MATSWNYSPSPTGAGRTRMAERCWPASRSPTSPGRGSLTESLLELANAVDNTVIDSVFVADHLMQSAPGTDPDEAMLEAFTTLGFVAAHTRCGPTPATPDRGQSTSKPNCSTAVTCSSWGAALTTSSTSSAGGPH